MHVKWSHDGLLEKHECDAIERSHLRAATTGDIADLKAQSLIVSRGRVARRGDDLILVTTEEAISYRIIGTIDGESYEADHVPLIIEPEPTAAEATTDAAASDASRLDNIESAVQKLCKALGV